MNKERSRYRRGRKLEREREITYRKYISFAVNFDSRRVNVEEH